METYDRRLGHQQAVEGVAVVKGQRPDQIGVAGGDRQQLDGGALQPLEEVAWRV